MVCIPVALRFTQTKWWILCCERHFVNLIMGVDSKSIDLLLISVDSPIMLGIYENKKLVKSLAKEGKFSDSLPQLFSEILAHDFISQTKEQLTNYSIVSEKSGLRGCEREDKTNCLSLKRTTSLCDLSPQDEFDIYYVNGPGNFSAIKLTHIFLQTLSIALNALNSSINSSGMKQNSAEQNKNNKIRLFCADAFHFSDSEFINAYGKIHFCKVRSEIHITTLESKRVNSFTLPETLDVSIFSNNCTPLYILPAV